MEPLGSPSRRLLARLLLAGASLAACEDTEQSPVNIQARSGSQGGTSSAPGGTGGSAGDTAPGAGGSNEPPGTSGGASAGTSPTSGGGATLAGAAGEPGEPGGSEASAGEAGAGEAGAGEAGAAGEAGGQAPGGGGQAPGGGGNAGETGGQASGQGGEAGTAGASGEIDCKEKPSVDPWVSTEPSELFGCCAEKAAIAKGEYVTACCETFHQCFTAEMMEGRFDPDCTGPSGIDTQGCPSSVCFFQEGYECLGKTPINNLPKQDDLCCYVFIKGSCCGRPIFVAQVARWSPLALRGDWA